MSSRHIVATDIHCLYRSFANARDVKRAADKFAQLQNEADKVGEQTIENIVESKQELEGSKAGKSNYR